MNYRHIIEQIELNNDAVIRMLTTISKLPDTDSFKGYEESLDDIYDRNMRLIECFETELKLMPKK